MTEKQKKQVDKEFGLSSWAINNKTTIYVMMVLILFLGISAFLSMPRENFPEIKGTKIYISSIYPGNTAEDIEKLITDPLEEKLKTVSNVIEITSTSQEDVSMVIVEFDENISVDQAKQKVKDEIDQKTSGEDWPTFNGAKVEPNVFELSISEEMPILNINISGDYPVDKLKEFGEYLEDEIENLSEIKKVDIRGAEEKEVEVAVDIYKMMAAKVSFQDILNAINGGNLTMSAGNLIASGQRRTIRILGEIKVPQELQDFVVKSEKGNAIYLKDIAKVTFKDKDKTTYAREFGEPVVMLDVKKRSGKNMVEAAEKIREIVKRTREDIFPSNLKVTIANDQSSKTIGQVDDLVNNIIFGVILVVLVLMFFLGFKNALFVGFAIPMSMFMSLMILNWLGYTMNTMILFGLIMGLGMLVDNGIVVVENVYRLMDEGMPRIEAAKKGIGEIAFPIIISTLTTVAAFVPLGMWPGVMGQFMIYFPVTLSVVLGSSLFVAIFFNSVMVSQFMSTEDKNMPLKRIIILSSIVGGIGLLILIFGGEYRALGSVMVFTAIMLWGYRIGLRPLVNGFQNKVLPLWERIYEATLRGALKGWRPLVITVLTVVMLVFSFGGFGKSIEKKRTKVEFFPDNTPNQIIVYIEYPQGTDIEKTNAIMQDLEARVYAILNAPEYVDNGYNFLVESAVSQVGAGSGNPQTDGGSTAEMPHRGKITASMREYKFRKGADSKLLQKKITESLKGIYPGLAISVEKEAVGPPAGYPINIELEGKDYTELINTAEKMRDFINSKSIPGVDELKIDVNKSKPSMLVNVDRKKAGELGVSSAQVGQQLRNAIFGSKSGVYKKNGEDYDIYVRFNKENRYNTSAVFNQKITFRDMTSGMVKEIPISAISKQTNTSGYSAVKHKQTKRVVTVYSALAPGYTDAAAIVDVIRNEMKTFTEKPANVKIDYTGQIEEQSKQMLFLMGAFFVGLGLIFFILIFQFNSISKPAIIMLAIFLSLIGVFGGLIITGKPFVIMMTMMGIISLAGIVVNNGVVLLDYTQLLIDRKKVVLHLGKNDFIDVKSLNEAIVRGGKARLRPVLLTAITTILGLIPLATGFNINFFTLFSEFDPNIYIGGDNVVFWGPLAWTVIYGLFIATFLTLVVVPILFYLIMRFKMWLKSNIA
ncbi:efflux RND transporter permease subunit [Tenacibaculum maritimum]|uniref:Probable multidrug resistance protein. AcrB/AcrD/AcrF family protein n=1 Tax=Tenacibaculum maritimum NCIMB 2154 TaxID=1349785 RepID=A0A2H1E716_9FLAO|nr:efflux RND transporter permease subunit [Tenacibaculum maritimum]MCD9561893.1 efflux RND transporter permease subunit [Tenacibaculum maritimum]MCD9564993.1 efflux RND transporter permease subunit [Tenacibaculum maritimum]MCD9578966.1 efflux RND transporter permease subunit [Tenacibaculum maritimum]MCD9584027.1 efflux RND transporter permease subunit [Tenacibaculum maritimum]MCD9595820.1 efflux RND transporter permease subunit [Tenacibaculum maritimum]